MTDFDMDDTPGVGLHSTHRSKDCGYVLVQPDKVPQTPVDYGSFYMYLRTSSPQAKQVYSESEGLCTLVLYLSGGLHQLLSIDEFRTYGRHDKIRFILKALVELGPREFPRGMTTVSQLLFIVNHLDRDSGGNNNLSSPAVSQNLAMCLRQKAIHTHVEPQKNIVERNNTLSGKC